LSAALFLGRHIQRLTYWNLKDIECARLPWFCSQRDHRSAPSHLSLLYGTGLRLSECLGLRVKDLDCERVEIAVRDGKGQKDRLTLLPRKLVPAGVWSAITTFPA
jgi:integrase